MRTSSAAIAALVLVALGGAFYAFSARPEQEGASPAPSASASGASASGAGSRERSLAALRAENDPVQRRRIARGMASLPDGIHVLRSAYEESDDGPVREEALLAASSLGGASAVRFLSEVAESDPRLGAQAGAALGAMVDPKTAGDLAGLVASDRSVLVRANAARALGASGSARESKVLLAAVADADAPLRVRQEAALSLGRIGDRSVAPGLGDVLVTCFEIQLLESKPLRISILQALRAIGGPEAENALRVHSEKQLSPDERAFAEKR